MLGEDGRGRKHGEEARWVRPGDAIPRRGGAMGAPRRRRSVARRRDRCAQETPFQGEEARWVRPGDADPWRGGAMGAPRRRRSVARRRDGCAQETPFQGEEGRDGYAKLGQAAQKRPSRRRKGETGRLVTRSDPEIDMAPKENRRIWDPRGHLPIEGHGGPQKGNDEPCRPTSR